MTDPEEVNKTVSLSIISTYISFFCFPVLFKAIGTFAEDDALDLVLNPRIAPGEVAGGGGATRMASLCTQFFNSSVDEI